MNENQQIVKRESSPPSSGLILRDMGQMMDFAATAFKSGLVPTSLKSPEAVFIALQLGAELGLPPMASLQNIAVVNGRPTLWGDALLGVVRQSGQLEEFREEIVGEGDDKGVAVTVKRRGYEVASETFTVADAKRAGLWGKAGPWTQYPGRMLKYRARSFVLRDQFGDILRGLHSAEELRDNPPEERNVTPSEPKDPFRESPPAKKAKAKEKSSAAPAQTGGTDAGENATGGAAETSTDGEEGLI